MTISTHYWAIFCVFAFNSQPKVCLSNAFVQLKVNIHAKHGLQKVVNNAVFDDDLGHWVGVEKKL